MENNHKTWIDNEYSQWVKALQESTVHNFKEHPVVKRMLGEPAIFNEQFFVENCQRLSVDAANMIYKIDQIGSSSQIGVSNCAYRYVYYALEILKRNPTSICEIGGGVGQFYAILRALGYKGEYNIIDIEQVREFQKKYLSEVNKQTGLSLELYLPDEPDLVVSFYALGEFDNETKNNYRWINRTPHGYIVWNPHSGATDDLSLFKHDIKVTPGIEEGIKIVTW